MTMPLIVLAVLSMIGGWVGLPDGLLWGDAFKRFLAPVLGHVSSGGRARRRHQRDQHGRAGGDVHRFRARLHPLYQTPALPGRIAASASALYELLLRKYYVDELYNAGLGRFLFWGSENVLNRGVDHGVIDGLVDGTGSASRAAARPRDARDRQRPALRVRLPARRGRNRRLLRLPGDGALMGGYWLTALIFVPMLGALFVLLQSEERAIWRSALSFR